jgi:galactan endo-beta-1,3-galactanase
MSRHPEGYTRRGALAAIGGLAAGAAALRAGTPSRAAGPGASPATFETFIDPSAFNSYQAFEAAWDYLYPWGPDHNGTARMFGSSTDHSQISLSGGVLTLKATKISDDEGTSSSSPHLPIHYHSGAVHAKSQIVVTSQFPNYEVKGDFQAPTVKGSWPAFWLTGVNSWPPESDILEFKGNSTNWYNTFRTSSDVSTNTIGVAAPGDWHTYRTWMTMVNSTDVDIHYYFDGVWQAVHHATGFVGKPMWVIINLQMEGSSGSPGPSGDTLYHARNVYVGRSVVS